jgi:hypothetical protein
MSSVPFNSTYAMLASVLAKSLKSHEAQEINVCEESLPQRGKGGLRPQNEYLSATWKIGAVSYQMEVTRMLLDKTGEARHLSAHIYQNDDVSLELTVTISNEALISNPEDERCIKEMGRLINIATAAFA